MYYEHSACLITFGVDARFHWVCGATCVGGVLEASRIELSQIQEQHGRDGDDPVDGNDDDDDDDEWEDF
jgi:hypothetical protein